MTDIPKLTDVEAAVLRVRLMHPVMLAHPNARITMLGLDDERASVGEAALAVYDAEQSRQIRAEVIAECLDWVRVHASCEGIAEKIVRDIEENVRP